MSEPALPPLLRLAVWSANGLLAAGSLAIALPMLDGRGPVLADLPVLAAAALASWLVTGLASYGRIDAVPTPVSAALAILGATLAAGLLGAAALSHWTWATAVAGAGLAGSAGLLVHLLVRWLWPHERRRVLLVGPVDCRARLREHLALHPEAGLEVVAEVGPGVTILAGCPAYPLGELEAAVVGTDPNEVLVSTGFDDHLLLMDVMARLLTRPLIVRYVPDPEALPLFCPRQTNLAGMPAIDLSRGPLTADAELVKWCEDKFVATVALLLLGLPMLAIAAAIKLTSPGPALFTQERHGRGGKTIRVYKFRTMQFQHCSADVLADTFIQAQRGDVRITPIGRFLRKTSLDETPQFLNVLFGDMSAVGPRPHLLALNQRFACDIGELMRRHYVKPGITGLAQINGARGETRTVEDMRRRVNLDLEYLRTWSLWLDLSILARTLVGGWINRQP